MKNKIILGIMMGIMVLSLASAMDCDGTYLGSFELDTDIQLQQTCDSCTYVTLNSITYSNDTVQVIIENMTKSGVDYNYSFHTSIPGYHYYTVFGDKAGVISTEKFCFLVGSQLNTGNSILATLILLVLIVFMLLSIKGVFKAYEGWSQIFYICVSYILLFSVFFLLWLLSKNYLYDIPLLESVFWIIWIVLAGLFFPFVIGVSAYILKKQAEALMEKDFVQQGYTREEARDMSKKSRRR